MIKIVQLFRLLEALYEANKRLGIILPSQLIQQSVPQGQQIAT